MVLNHVVEGGVSIHNVVPQNHALGKPLQVVLTMSVREAIHVGEANPSCTS